MASTETPGTSKDTLARIQPAWIEFRVAGAALGVDELERPTSAGWTYKEMYAHVAAWHELTARRLRALRETGQRLDPPEAADDDAFNARAAASARGRSVAAVLEALDASVKAMLGEIAQLSDSQLAAHGGWARKVIAGNTYGHYAEHRDELFAAVPRTRRALEPKLESGWRRFRDAAGRADLEREIRPGWSGLAVVTHAARWLETLGPELALRLEGKRSAPPDIQAENERSIALARELTPAAALARLDAASGDVLARLRALAPDAEVPFPAVGVVATRGYAHFAEHAPELEGIAR